MKLPLRAWKDVVRDTLSSMGIARLAKEGRKRGHSTFS
jgi:hypothetical protein